MNIIIAGAGSAGGRFEELLLDRGHVTLTYDPLVYHTTHSWREALKGHDAAIICSPPSFHCTQASDCIRAGVPVLIEKPAALEARHTQGLLKLQALTGTPAFVGYNLRFVPLLNRLVEWSSERAYHARLAFGYDLRFWRPGTDVRQGYGPWREKGGGILLDASHEIDTAVRMFGRPKEVAAMLAPVRKHLTFGNTDGAADLLLKFDRDRTASIHLDYFSSVYHRITQTFSSTPMETVIGLDTWKIGAGDGSVARSYGAELDEFLAVIKKPSRRTALATLADGHLVLEVIDAARRSVKTSRAQTLKQLKRNWKAGA